MLTRLRRGAQPSKVVEVVQVSSDEDDDPLAAKRGARRGHGARGPSPPTAVVQHPKSRLKGGRHVAQQRAKGKEQETVTINTSTEEEEEEGVSGQEEEEEVRVRRAKPGHERCRSSGRSQQLETRKVDVAGLLLKRKAKTGICSLAQHELNIGVRIWTPNPKP